MPPPAEIPPCRVSSSKPPFRNTLPADLWHLEDFRQTVQFGPDNEPLFLDFRVEPATHHRPVDLLAGCQGFADQIARLAGVAFAVPRLAHAIHGTLQPVGMAIQLVLAHGIPVSAAIQRVPERTAKLVGAFFAIGDDPGDVAPPVTTRLRRGYARQNRRHGKNCRHNMGFHTLETSGAEIRCQDNRTRYYRKISLGNSGRSSWMETPANVVAEGEAPC